MRTDKPVSQMTPQEKAALKAYMIAKGYFDDDDFPGVLGNKNSFVFSEVQVNRPVAATKFVFEPPPGTTVVKP